MVKLHEYWYQRVRKNGKLGAWTCAYAEYSELNNCSVCGKLGGSISVKNYYNVLYHLYNGLEVFTRKLNLLSTKLTANNLATHNGYLCTSCGGRVCALHRKLSMATTIRDEANTLYKEAIKCQKQPDK